LETPISTSAHRFRSTAPWIAAVVAALVLAGLIVAYVVTDSDSSRPTGSLTDSEQQAVAAASTIVANLGTFSRADFDKDYQRALDATTGSLHSQVAKDKSLTKKSLTANKFDISVKIRHAALESSGTISSSKSKTKVFGYVVLVSFYRYLSTAADNPTPQDLEITVHKAKGTWLASDASPVGIQ